MIDTPIYGEGEQSEAFKAHLGQSVLFPKRLGSGEELAFTVMECITNPYLNAETIGSTVASGCHRSRGVHMSENNAVIVERRDRVMIITLNRPDAMNAINGDLSHGLWNACTNSTTTRPHGRCVDGRREGLQLGHGPQGLRGEDTGPMQSSSRPVPRSR